MKRSRIGRTRRSSAGTEALRYPSWSLRCAGFRTRLDMRTGSRCTRSSAMELIEHSAVVLLSGGQKSCECLTWARQHFTEVIALTGLYPRGDGEVICAQRWARKWKCQHHVLDMGGLETRPPLPLTTEDLLAAIVLPADHLVLLTLAASFAAARGIGNVVTGHTGRRDMLDAFQRIFWLATGDSVAVHTPLLSKVPECRQTLLAPAG